MKRQIVIAAAMLFIMCIIGMTFAEASTAQQPAVSTKISVVNAHDQLRGRIGIGRPGVGVGLPGSGIGFRPGIGVGAPGLGWTRYPGIGWPGVGGPGSGIGYLPGIGIGRIGIGWRPGIG